MNLFLILIFQNTEIPQDNTKFLHCFGRSYIQIILQYNIYINSCCKCRRKTYILIEIQQKYANVCYSSTTKEKEKYFKREFFKTSSVNQADIIQIYVNINKY